MAGGGGGGGGSSGGGSSSSAQQKKHDAAPRSRMSGSTILDCRRPRELCKVLTCVCFVKPTPLWGNRASLIVDRSTDRQHRQLGREVNSTPSLGVLKASLRECATITGLG